MAQLTWRNVDAPNFSGANEALRNAGALMDRGFTAARQSIDSFQADQTRAESARLMAASMGVTNPNELAGVIARFNPGNLSPEALKFVADRPQDMARLDQTRTVTQGQTLANEFSQANNPQRLESQRLSNASTAISNAAAGTDLNQKLWNNQNTRDQYAAAPAWMQRHAEIRTLLDSGDPTLVARGRSMAADPESVRLANAAGIKDVGTLFTGNNEAVAAGIKTRDAWLASDEATRARTLTTTAREMSNALMAESGNSPSYAARIMESRNDIPADLRQAILTNLQPMTPAEGGTVSEVLANEARRTQAGGQAQSPQGGDGFVTYRNQGATRNQPLAPPLVQAMSFLPQLGVTMQVTSGGQDGIESGSKNRTGSTRHDHGGAGDVQFMHNGRALSWERTQDVPMLQEIVRQAKRNGVTGIGAGPGYMNPTTTHIGFGREAVWGAKGSQPYTALAEAVGGAPAGQSRAVQMLSQARQPISAPDLRSPAGAPIQLGLAGSGAAPAFQPGPRMDTPTQLLTESTNAASALSAASDMNRIDTGFQPASHLIEAFNNQPEKKSSPAEMAANLKKSFGDDKQGLFLGTERLTVETLQNDVNKVMSKYGVNADLAGAFIQNAIRFESGWIGPDGRSVDHAALGRHIDKFIGKDGKPKAELLSQVRQKAALDKRTSDASQAIETARQEFVNAQAARDRGNTRVNVELARERLERTIQAARATAGSVVTNPNLLVNTAARTGR